MFRFVSLIALAALSASPAWAQEAPPAEPSLKVTGGAFAPAQDGIGGDSNIYLFGDAGLPIGGTPITLNGHVGRSQGDTTLTPGGDHLDWSLGASAAWRNPTFGAAFIDTDIARSDAIVAGATKAIVAGAVVLSLGASF